MTNLMSHQDLLPDWARYHSPAELEQEAMDYEFGAAYDDVSERYGDQTDYGGHEEDIDEVFTCEAPEITTVPNFDKRFQFAWLDRSTIDDLPF